MSTEFLFNTILFLLLYFGISFGAGQLVLMRGVKVNYTRKINHFSLYFVPLLVDKIVPYEITSATGLARLGIILFCLGVMIRPIRQQIRFTEVMYVGFDRPEDRPHTMMWLLTQIVAGFLVIIPLQVYWATLGLADLLLIPTIINVFGDGLAEPVGIRFGKHTYETKALWTEKRFIRSYEGSAMLFASGVVALLLTADLFSPMQLTVGLLTIPIIMTLTEAYSPHTWDTPFLYLVGGLLLIMIMLLVP